MYCGCAGGTKQKYKNYLLSLNNIKPKKNKFIYKYRDEKLVWIERFVFCDQAMCAHNIIADIILSEYPLNGTAL